MKMAYTKIVSIEANENSATISFRPKGSDTSNPPVKVHVSPHDTYIHLALSNIQNRRVLACDLGGNTASVKFGDLTKHEC